MKIFQATYYGFDPCHYVIAAKNVEEAIEIVATDGYGRPLEEDVWEINNLQIKGDVKEPCIIIQF